MVLGQYVGRLRVQGSGLGVSIEGASHLEKLVHDVLLVNFLQNVRSDHCKDSRLRQRFRAYDSGFRAQGLGYRVQGSEFTV